MNPSTGNMRTPEVASYLPAVLTQSRLESGREIYEQNRHRVYSLAFWMTDNELAAEELMTQAFCGAFACNAEPTADDIDRALIAQLRNCFDLQSLTLNCAPCERVLSVRRNTLRVDLERAVVQLPSAEKLMFLLHDVEGYDHGRIARLLGSTQNDSRHGVHQARLRIRELLAS
ncbi:MAG: sigma factor-like helix-turn-helix DNA-binding protein [Acidobacteriaceae bacterium]